MKMEKPTTNMLRVRFMLANCKIEIPVPAASHDKTATIRNANHYHYPGNQN
jgi:hypothetical protein